MEALANNSREAIGGNNPPSIIEGARNCFTTLSAFLTENPVFETEETARAAAGLLARAKLTIKDIEAERRKLGDPFKAQLDAVNERYKKPRETIQAILDELSGRLTTYNRAEEARRAAVAEEKRLAAIEAERIARAAETAEQEAKDNAAVGEVVNVVQAIVEADHAFDQFSLASRTAACAEREVPVRLGTGLGRAVSMRTKETLTVENWQHAIEVMGCNEAIREAILTGARAYRKLKGELPKGVTSTPTREI